MGWNVVAGFVPGRAGGIMAWEGPAAGLLLDQALAGTFVDRQLLQPIGRAEDKWSGVSALVVLPLIGAALDGGMPPSPFMVEAAEDAFIAVAEAILAAEAERKRQIDAIDRRAREAGHAEGMAEARAEFMTALFGRPDPEAVFSEPRAT